MISVLLKIVQRFESDVRQAEGSSSYPDVGVFYRAPKNNAPVTVLAGKLTYSRRPGRSEILLPT